MSIEILNSIMTGVGYIILALAFLVIVIAFYEHAQAADWYYRNFNSKDVNKLRKVIIDAELKIKEIKENEK